MSPGILASSLETEPAPAQTVVATIATVAEVATAAAAAEPPPTSYDSCSHSDNENDHSALEASRPTSPMPARPCTPSSLSPKRATTTVPTLPSELIYQILAQRAVTAADHLPFLAASRLFQSIALASLSHRVLAGSLGKLPELRVRGQFTPLYQSPATTKLRTPGRSEDNYTLSFTCVPAQGRGANAPPLLRKDDWEQAAARWSLVHHGGASSEPSRNQYGNRQPSSPAHLRTVPSHAAVQFIISRNPPLPLPAPQISHGAESWQSIANNRKAAATVAKIDVPAISAGKSRAVSRCGLVEIEFTVTPVASSPSTETPSTSSSSSSGSSGSASGPAEGYSASDYPLRDHAALMLAANGGTARSSHVRPANAHNPMLNIEVNGIWTASGPIFANTAHPPSPANHATTGTTVALRSERSPVATTAAAASGLTATTTQHDAPPPAPVVAKRTTTPTAPPAAKKAAPSHSATIGKGGGYTPTTSHSVGWWAKGDHISPSSSAPQV
ncbi:hypothetical protein BDZ88DRAFT_424777 [Geranomyces variabilis]|nr:hypothetical protein BDZ88DRAFT_424777 [Geranomyces variabilis]KAJ3140727.1 hypothetical protein HDU90_008031 [Geranomyces variabilis]